MHTRRGEVLQPISSPGGTEIKFRAAGGGNCCYLVAIKIFVGFISDCIVTNSSCLWVLPSRPLVESKVIFYCGTQCIATLIKFTLFKFHTIPRTPAPRRARETRCAASGRGSDKRWKCSIFILFFFEGWHSVGYTRVAHRGGVSRWICVTPR